MTAPTDRQRLGWTLGLTSVAFFMVVLDALVVITALPAMQRELGGSISTLQWTVNAYGLTYAAGIITGAALGDRFGRRRMFAVGLLLFTAASAACGLAPTAATLIAARTIQGLGAAMVMPLSLTILTTTFPAARRGAVVGIWGGLAGLAVAIGPLLGGALTQGLNWHWIFWVNVPIGLAAAALSMLYLPESRGRVARFDLGGVALISSGAIGVVWALVRGGDVGWFSVEVAPPLVIGVVLLLAFVTWESRVAEPMVPLRLFRIRAFAAGNATAFLMIGSLFSAAFLISQYFQSGLHLSPLATGVRLLPWTATPMVIAPLAGMISDKVGRRPVMVTGMLLQGLGLAWFAVVATTSSGYLDLLLPLLIAGVGISMALPTVPTAILGAVTPSDTGVASGINSMMQRFGSVFGVAVVSAVLAGGERIGDPVALVSGFRPALGVAAALSLLGTFTAAAITATRRSPAPAAQQVPHAVPAG